MSEVSTQELSAHTEVSFEQLALNLVALSSDPRRFIGAPRSEPPEKVKSLLENREALLGAIAQKYPAPGVRSELANGFLNVAMKVRVDAEVYGVRAGVGGKVQEDIDLVAGIISLVKGVSNPYKFFDTEAFAGPFELDKATEVTQEELNKIIKANGQPEAVKLTAQTLVNYIDNMKEEAMKVYKETHTSERNRIRTMTDPVAQNIAVERLFNQHISEEFKIFSASKR